MIFRHGDFGNYLFFATTALKLSNTDSNIDMENLGNSTLVTFTVISCVLIIGYVIDGREYVQGSILEVSKSVNVLVEKYELCCSLSGTWSGPSCSWPPVCAPSWPGARRRGSRRLEPPVSRRLSTTGRVKLSTWRDNLLGQERGRRAGHGGHVHHHRSHLRRGHSLVLHCQEENTERWEGLN